MRRLAKTYGLSDVGLAKICRKHDIPRPPRGYWAKKEHGKAPAQTPLPNPQRDEKIELRDHGQYITSPSPLRQHITEKTAEEQRPEKRIEVAETLRGSHELVSRANQELSSAAIDDDRLIIRPKGATLNIVTSKASLRRAFLIMDALLRAFAQRGYEVEAGPTVTLMGVSLRFGIREQVETRREEPEDHDLDGPYMFGHSRFKTKRVPSGRLTLAIDQAMAHRAGGLQRTWRDTEKQRLEERLNDFVAGCVTLAGRLKAHEEEQRRQTELRRQEAERQAELRRQAEAQRQEEERQLAEKRKQYEAELARVDELLTQAASYSKSRQVREAHSVNGPIEPGSEVAKWIEWATQQADRLDPLRPSPPSILDEDLGDVEEPQRDRRHRW